MSVPVDQGGLTLRRSAGNSIMCASSSSSSPLQRQRRSPTSALRTRLSRAASDCVAAAAAADGTGHLCCASITDCSTGCTLSPLTAVMAQAVPSSAALAGKLDAACRWLLSSCRRTVCVMLRLRRDLNRTRK